MTLSKAKQALVDDMNKRKEAKELNQLARLAARPPRSDAVQYFLVKKKFVSTFCSSNKLFLATRESLCLCYVPFALVKGYVDSISVGSPC